MINIKKRFGYINTNMTKEVEDQIKNLSDENDTLKIKIKNLEDEISLLKQQNDIYKELIDKNNLTIEDNKQKIESNEGPKILDFNKMKEALMKTEKENININNDDEKIKLVNELNKIKKDNERLTTEIKEIKQDYIKIQNDKNELSISDIVDYIIIQEKLTKQEKNKLLNKYERCDYLHRIYKDKLNIFKFDIGHIAHMTKEEWKLWLEELHKLIKQEYSDVSDDVLIDKCDYVYTKGKNKGEKCNKIECRTKSHRAKTKIH